MTVVNALIVVGIVLAFCLVVPLIDLSFWSEVDDDYGNRLAGIVLVLAFPLLFGIGLYLFAVSAITRKDWRNARKRVLALLTSPLVGMAAALFGMHLGWSFLVTFGLVLPGACGLAVRVE